jgi:Arc/MetJ-type ribon-helix-helix transcriptional regulator
MANENLNEKVSVNINTSTLSEVDLLVDNGYYSNRSDFINYALRQALQENRSTIDRIIEKNTKASGKENNWFIGLYGFTAKEIEEMYAGGEKITLSGYGVLSIDKDCDEEKLFAVVESIKHSGKVICSQSVKEHYGLNK